MNRCPRERQARGEQCKVRGCDHRTSRMRRNSRHEEYLVSRICKCCVARCGERETQKLNLLRLMGTLEDAKAFEDELILRVNAMAPRMMPSRGMGANHYPGMSKSAVVPGWRK